MTYDNTDDLDENLDIEPENTLDIKPSEEKSADVRKRIDDLLERKRLKELLDDSDDWDI
ncbi:PA3496 family putative envelope integrity protein [Thalassotalea marina]|uniref:Uncharacterized protein n=1 Tax=Thalassotalea marina TaxID=1673741 RepID=A0A919EJ76_9GAMM|nr:hypothetical protein [Thalassotalea marina]GHF85689.1 hypothetical protein GCM10017161_11600 [Thalassotalea marina]